jgi:hypothetical protein
MQGSSYINFVLLLLYHNCLVWKPEVPVLTPNMLFDSRSHWCPSCCSLHLNSVLCLIWFGLLNCNIKLSENTMYWMPILNNVTLKMTVFWEGASCSLVDVYQSFRGGYCHHHAACIIILIVEAASISETLVNFYQTTCRNIPGVSIFIPSAIRSWNIRYNIVLSS